MMAQRLSAVEARRADVGAALAPAAGVLARPKGGRVPAEVAHVAQRHVHNRALREADELAHVTLGIMARFCWQVKVTGAR